MQVKNKLFILLFLLKNNDLFQIIKLVAQQV